MSEIIMREDKAIGERYYYTKHKSGLDIYVIPKKFRTSYAIFSTKYLPITRFRGLATVWLNQCG